MREGAALEEEALLLGRYLVGREPSPALRERYARAHQRLLARAPDATDVALVRFVHRHPWRLGPARAPDATDVALLRFVHRHPWSLGPLDAACGLLRPGRLLRNKILIMAAVLEASPEFAEDFLPRPSGWPALLVTMLIQGARASLRAAFGLALYPLAARR